jgi:hypothetical protein
MKKILLAATLGLLTLNVQASAICEADAGMAKVVMELRQDNTPRPKLEEVVHSERGRAIVDLAWTFEIGRTKADKKRIAEAYKVHIYNTCTRVFENAKKGVDGISM